MLAIMAGEQFWVLGHLTDTLLLEQLRCVLQRKRRALAELLAHLAEVEERRLHLSAAHTSLFSYCVHVLGMSEDEACRRIELARLARQYPLLFGELASGRISLSVALLLKPFLSADNQRELIAAARGSSLRTASCWRPVSRAPTFPNKSASCRSALRLRLPWQLPCPSSALHQRLRSHR